MVRLHIQWLPMATYLGVKRPRREAVHSPATSADVKETWIYTSTPPYAFMAYCLISYVQRQLCLFKVVPVRN
jgi:hypothetical protein